MDIPEEAIFQDGHSIVIFLDTDRKDIVFFQALFESYEGVGTVRTADKSKALLAILTTPSMFETVLAVLNSLPNAVEWRYASHLHPDEKNRYVELP